jgi:hypothetical protein
MDRNARITLIDTRIMALADAIEDVVIQSVDAETEACARLVEHEDTLAITDGDGMSFDRNAMRAVQMHLAEQIRNRAKTA